MKSKMKINHRGNKIQRLPNGKQHREDGPAVEQESNGTKQWYIKGQLHREDWPAEEYGGGDKCWWLNG